MELTELLATVLQAYRNAAALVKRIREKKEGTEGASSPNEWLQDLEDSLALGPPVIKGQYDHDLKRFGESYACGDSQAREQMKDVLITLQITVLSNLQEVLIDDAELDYAALQSASDDSRVNAVVCLGQLSQRISAAAAANAMLPEHNMPYPTGSERMQMSPSLHYSSSRSTRSTETMPLTPGPISERLAQMGLGQFGPKPPFSGSAASMYSAGSNHTRVMYPPRKPVPLVEAELSPPSRVVNPPPLGVHRLSNDSIEGLRRPSSHTLAPEDSVLLIPGVVQSPEATERPTSEISDEPDRASFAQSNANKTGPESPELSRTPSDRHSNASRDRYNPDDYHDLAYTRGGLDDPRLNYPAMYGNRNIPPVARWPSNPPSQQSTYPSNHSTLEHVAYLQANARPPAMGDYQINQQTHSPAPQVGQPVYHPALDRSRTVPLRTHEATRTPSLASPFQEGAPSLGSVLQPPERAASLASPKPPMGPPPATPTPDRMARASVSAPIPVTSDRVARSYSTSTNSSIVPTALPVSQHSQHSVSPQTGPGAPAFSFRPTQPIPLPSQPQSVAPFVLALPAENNLHGFCKGAVKLQINPAIPKKAFSVANRPAGLTGTIPFFQCSKCSFEGPAVMSVNVGSKKTKAEKTFDSRVRVAENGIRYRWVFLAKSHVQCKSMPEGPTARDGSFGAFACIFCCAEGAGRGWGTTGSGTNAPTFGNVGSFMEHLQIHRRAEASPGAEMQTKAKCIVGRVAEAGEDFEINLPPLS